MFEVLLLGKCCELMSGFALCIKCSLNFLKSILSIHLCEILKLFLRMSEINNGQNIPIIKQTDKASSIKDLNECLQCCNIYREGHVSPFQWFRLKTKKVLRVVMSHLFLRCSLEQSIWGYSIGDYTLLCFPKDANASVLLLIVFLFQ